MKVHSSIKDIGRFLIVAWMSFTMVASPYVAHALPSGHQVQSGGLDISSLGNQLNINQLTPQAIANWESFSIGNGQVVNIQQLNEQSMLLNRVTGANPSELLGQLNANGRVFLINPNGVLVGPNASINTAEFMASTLDISDQDFLNGGDMLFTGDSTESVVNFGSIIAENGDVILLAYRVVNEGEIKAEQGVAALGAGNEIVFSPESNQRIMIKTDLSNSGGGIGVDQAGVIEAAQAELKAAGGNVYELAVNQSGFTKATGIESKNGRVLITSESGTIGHSGTIVASNADGSGGEVLLGGDYRGENADIVNAARSVVTEDGVIDVSATADNADAGRAIVWADEATRFLGTIQGQGGSAGGDGAFAEVSGKQFLDFQGLADLTASSGQNGQLLLDPNSLNVHTAAADENITSSDPGSDPFIFEPSPLSPSTFDLDSLESFLSVATLEAQLALSDVILDTSFVDIDINDGAFGIPEPGDGTIAVQDAVTWTSGNSLTLKAGNNIEINADLNAVGADIILSGGTYLPDWRNPVFAGQIDVASGASITADTLTINRNPDASFPDILFFGGGPPPPPFISEGSIGGIDIAGVLNVTTLDIQLPAEAPEAPDPLGDVEALLGGIDGALIVNNPANQIEFLKIAPSDSEPGTVEVNNVDIVDSSGGLTVLAQLGSVKGGLSIVTEGDLTLQSGTAINGSNGDIHLVSKSGSFINNADAQAITFTDASRFLIYSDDPANTVKGGIAGNSLYNATFAGNPPGTITQTGSRFVYSLAPTLTVSASGTRDYWDGNETIDYTFPVSGLVGDDTAEGAFSGMPTFSTTLGIGENAGFYEDVVSVGLGTLVSDFGYQLAVADGDLTIEKATLTVTPNSATREYGAAEPAFSGVLSGFKNGETVSVIDSLPTYATDALITSNVGTYEIFGTGGLDNNYDFSFADGADLLSITPAALIFTADSASRVYGASNPVFSAQLTGAKNGDNITDFPDLVFSTPDSDVNSSVSGGPYLIRPGGATNPNYTYGYVDGALSITPAELTIRADDAVHQFDNDVPDPATYTASFEGLVADDQASDYTGQLLFANTTTGATTGSFDIDVSGVVDSNYTITFAPGTLTIGSQVLTVRANDFTRLYGQTNPMFTYEPITGFFGGDTEASVLLTPVTFTTIANLNSGVGTYDIVPGGATADAYDFDFINGTLTIDPALLTIQAIDNSRLYGAVDPDFEATFNGLVADDTKNDITGLTFSTDAVVDSDVGSGYTITPENGTNVNYTISFEPGNFSITPAPLTIAANDASRLYGAADPTFDASFTGLVAGDLESDIAGLTFSTTALLDSNVGSANAIIPAGASSGNYTISFTDGNLSITPAPLTIAADSFSRIYGEANPLLTTQFTGLVAGDTRADISGLSVSTAAVETSDVDDYAIVVSGATNTNYTITPVDGTLSVTPRPITATIGDGIKVFGDDNPDFTLGFDNLASFDDASDLSNFAAATAATRLSDVGDYEIVLSGAEANYEIVSSVNGNLSITQRPVTVTAANATREYGDANPSFLITTTEQVSGAPLGDGGLIFTTDAVQSSNIGVYTVTPGGIINDNYAINYVTGNLTITTAPLSYRANSLSREYGDPNGTLTFRDAIAYKLSDDVDDVLENVSVTTTGTQTANVGTYTINLNADIINPNYDVTLTNGTVSISKADLFIVPELSSRLYGDPNPTTYTLSATGLKNDDTAAVVQREMFQNFTFSDRDVGSYGGVVQILFADARNYNLTFGAGTMNILPRPLTITADDATREYGAANPTFTTTFEGLASFDTPSAIPDVSVFTNTTPSSNVLEGGYGLIPSSGTNRNYTISYQSGRLNITPAPLLVNIASATRQYATANPAFGVESAFGFKLTDDINSLFLDYSTEAVPTSDVGNYLITATSENPNYELNVSPNVLEITPAPVTLRIESGTTLERRYGEPNVDFADDLIVAGLQFGATEDAVVRVTNPTQVFTPIGQHFLQAESLDPNYEIISFANNDFFIQQRPLDLVFNDASKLYGDATPDLLPFLDMDGLFVVGDSPSNVFGPITTEAGLRSDVGDYAISVSSINSNYGINSITGDFTIQQRPLTVFLDPVSRIYGEANPMAFDSFLRPTGTESLPSFEALNNVLDISLPGVDADVGEYAMTATLKNANYTLSGFDGRLDIIPRAISVALPEVRSFSRVYAEPNPEVGEFVEVNPFGAINEGIASFDTIDDVITFNLPGITDDAGEYFMENIISKSSNYDIDLEGEFEFFVEPRPIILRGPSVTRVYGEQNPTLDFFNITPDGPASGLAPFDALTEQVTLVSIPDERANVGTYELEALSRNYSPVFGEGGQITITERPLFLTVSNEIRTYGEAVGSVDITSNSTGAGAGPASFDTLGELVSANLPAIDADAGQYKITLDLLDPNYSLGQVTGPDVQSSAAPYSEILQRNLSVELPGADRLYGDANTGEAFSIVSGTLPNFASVKDVFTVMDLPSIDARPGDYTVVEFLDEKNYDISVLEGSDVMTIFKRTISVDVIDLFKTFGETGDAFELVITGDGFAAADAAQGTVDPVLSDPTGLFTRAGHYGIVDIDLNVDSDFYQLDYTPSVFTVLPRVVSLEIDNISLDFDSVEELSTYLANENLVVDATVNNLAPGDTFDSAFPIIRYQVTDSNAVPSFGPAPTADNIVIPAGSVFVDDPELVRLDIALPSNTSGTSDAVVRTGSVVNLGDSATINRFVTVLDGFDSEENYFLSEVTNGSVRLKVPSEIVGEDPELNNGTLITLPNGSTFVLSESTITLDKPDVIKVGGGGGLNNFFAFGNYDIGVDMITGLAKSLFESGETQSFAEGSLFYEISRTTEGTLEDLSPFRIQRWFERNAGNPEAMAMLAEPLSHYAAAFLDKDPDTYTESESGFAALLRRNLEDARNDVAVRVEAEKDAWIKKEEAKGNNAADLFGKDVPWGEFMADAAGEYVAEDVEAKIALAVGGGAAGGAAAGGVMVGLTGAILPFAAVKVGGMAAMGTGSIAAGTSMTGIAATSVGVAFPVAIVAGAIVGSIARGVMVFENKEQQEQYDALVDRGRIDLNEFDIGDQNEDEVTLNQTIMLGALTSMLTGN